MLASIHGIIGTPGSAIIPVDWSLVSDSSFGTSNIFGIEFSEQREILVAVGQEGKLATCSFSTAPESWTQRSSTFGANSIYSVHYAQNKFLAAGSGGRMAISEDGIAWSAVSSSSFGLSATIFSVTYSSELGLWFAVGTNGQMATSPNALNWTQVSSSFGTQFIYDIHAGGETLIAVGQSGRLATSTEGSSWTQRSSSFLTTNIRGISSNSNYTGFVIVGDEGKIGRSSNAISWTQAFPASVFGFSTIKTASEVRDLYIAAGFLGKIGTSTDRNSWILRVVGPEGVFGNTTINSLEATNNLVVAAGDAGKIAYSEV